MGEIHSQSDRGDNAALNPTTDSYQRLQPSAKGTVETQRWAARLERIEKAAREVVEAWDAMPNTLPEFPGILEWNAATVRLREALDA